MPERFHITLLGLILMELVYYTLLVSREVDEPFLLIVVRLHGVVFEVFPGSARHICIVI